MSRQQLRRNRLLEQEKEQHLEDAEGLVMTEVLLFPRQINLYLIHISRNNDGYSSARSCLSNLNFMTSTVCAGRKLLSVGVRYNLCVHRSFDNCHSSNASITTGPRYFHPLHLVASSWRRLLTLFTTWRQLFVPLLNAYQHNSINHRSLRSGTDTDLPSLPRGNLLLFVYPII